MFGQCRGRPHRQAAAEAEADRPDAVALHPGWAVEEVGGAAHVLLGLLHRERHHLLFGLARLAGGLAAVEVGGQGEEALGGEPVADRAYVPVKAPPLLQHDRRGARLARRHCEVAGRRAGTGGELDIGHGLAPSFSGWGSCACASPRRGNVRTARAPRADAPSPQARGGIVPPAGARPRRSTRRQSMSAAVNHQYRLAARPVGLPSAATGVHRGGRRRSPPTARCWSASSTPRSIPRCAAG